MIVKGQNLMCFVGGKSIAFATNHTLEVTANTLETSTKDNAGGEWDSFEVNTLAWTCSSENLIGDTRQGHGYDDLFAMMIAKKPVTLVFGYKTGISAAGEAYEVPEGGWKNDAAKHYYSGDAYITSLSLNAPNGENTSMSVSFTGHGALKQLPAGNSVSTMSLNEVAATAKTAK